MQTSVLYKYFIENPVVCTDTRAIEKGCLFFALKGENFDGNKYASEAIKKGAAFAVVDDESVVLGKQYLLVDNVLLALQKLANYHRKQLNTTIIAITGSNGKTTTKELIATVLLQRYNVCYTIGNLNNHIGVPLTILRFTKETQIAIVEMGANHHNEIAHLCSIAEPNYGIITNIGKAHLEGFGSVEGVLKAKSELYTYLRLNGGKCFVNGSNQQLMQNSEGIERITYGNKDQSFMYGELIDNSYFLAAKLMFPKGWLYFKTMLVGAYNFENLMAAACVGHYLEVDPLRIKEAIDNYSPSNNRSQLFQVRTNKVILDAYNANPTSMKGALENFKNIKHPNKVVILGDMLELGEYSNIEHKNIIEYLSNFSFCKIYLVGSNFKEANELNNINTFLTVGLLQEYLQEQKPIEDSIILIKGSRGTKLETILENL